MRENPSSGTCPGPCLAEFHDLNEFLRFTAHNRANVAGLRQDQRPEFLSRPTSTSRDKRKVDSGPAARNAEALALPG